ncbi:hypothetical protein [Anaeroarcus burkinensis]|uniref:hypothetical protein n=1 Tax=Anaeroarcus burkinensis TaxID=82376 RepID=UPI000423BDA3|nr:hypothetical protein [Anaeroarcus burkinensis]
MRLGDAMECLEAGKLSITASDVDVVLDEQGERIIIDHRIDDENDPKTVQKIGVDVQGYLQYICPECRQVHAIHKSQIGQGALIYPGCRDSGSHGTKSYINDQGKLVKKKLNRFFLKREK